MVVVEGRAGIGGGGGGEGGGGAWRGVGVYSTQAQVLDQLSISKVCACVERSRGSFII